MRIPEPVLQEILRKANIVDVVGEYVNLQQKGDRYWGLSPFKPEKTPSFSVSPERNAYYCFSTSQGGNSISFIMEMEHLTFPEAARFLAKKYGIALEENEELSEESKVKNALEDLYQKLAGSFHHLLLHNKQGSAALDYARSRGLSDESIEEFQLGYAPGDPAWLYKFLISKSYSKKLLEQSGLFSRKHPEYPIFTNRLIFPIVSSTRQILAFGGRILGGEGPKYINSPETLIYKKGANLYGLAQAKDSIKKHGSAIICEGYMDVIALHQGGLKNAVAPLGTAFTEEQGHLVKRLTNKLNLLFDGDSAGIRATEKTLMLAEKLEFETSIITLPDAKDPGDILMRDGSQGIKKIVDYKIHAFEYMLKRACDGTRIHSPEGKEQIIRDFVPYLASMVSELRLGACINMIADTLSVEPRIVFKEFERRNNRPSIQAGPSKSMEPEQRRSEQRKTSVSQGTLALGMEFKLLLAVFLHPDQYASFRNLMPLEDLRDADARDMYIALEESFREGSFDFETLISRLESEELRSLVRRRQLNEEFANDTEKFIKEGVYRIKFSLLESRRNNIEQALNRFNHMEKPDFGAIKELLEEKMIIDQTLRDMSRNE